MSATGGKITLKFEVDIAELEAKMSRAKSSISGLEPALQKTDQALEKTSQATVTSAVRFQTLSQGAINLTTSFAQTYTSLSNIQRAQTSVAQATISLERAEDQLQRKQVQLNKEREKAVPNMDKIKLLTNEISTAERDLAVKQQKLKDTTDQANDTNILFGINLLNVSFSAIQTGKSMIDMAKATTVASVGVGGVTKSLGFLRTALTFIQKHPVFLVVTAGILAWEFGISKLIKQVNGVDLSIQGLTEKAFGLDQMKTSTQILGTEFENTGYQIDSMGGTMDSVSGDMVSSIGRVGVSVSELKGAFVNISSTLRDIGAAAAGIGGTPSVLDYIKSINSEISSVVSDLNMLTEKGLDMESAKKLILDDILQDENEINKSLVEQLKAGTLTIEQYKEQLDILDKIFDEKKNIIRAAEEQIRTEKALGQVLTENQKKTTKFGKFGIDVAKTAGIDSDSVRGQVLNLTGRDIGSVANSMSLNEALRIANIETFTAQYRNTIGGKTQGLLDYLNIQANAFRTKSSQNDLRTVLKGTSSVMGGNVSGGTNFFGVGFYKSAGATAAYQVDSVAVPSWVKQQIKEQDAWRNSVEGQLSTLGNALYGGTHFAFTQSFFKRGGRGLSGIDANTVRLAGLLGLPAEVGGRTPIGTTVSTARESLSAFIQQNNLRQDFLFAALDAITQTSTAAIKRTLPMGFSGIRSGGVGSLNRDIRNLTQIGLQNYISRVSAGNFGEYDATLLNAMTSAVVGELSHETTVFNSQIAPLLNISHSDFKSTLVDPKRGINEVDDRIRWTQRLESISTGATVF